MRILVCGPTYPGSIGPYVAQLNAELAGFENVEVTSLSSSQLPYNETEGRLWTLKETGTEARRLESSCNPRDFDLIVYHYGNLEVEQLIPTFWGSDRTPSVCHVHTLRSTLFNDHIVDSRTADAVEKAANSHDGYLYFGSYALSKMRDFHGGHKAVSWWPGTIPPDATDEASSEIVAAVDTDLPLITQLGYASPWKQPELLMKTANRLKTPARVVLAGPFWDDPAQTGIDLALTVNKPHRIGNVEFFTVARFLTPADRKLLVDRSTLGVFPYQDHPTHQGSAAVSDYLAAGVPVIATDISNFDEVISTSGLVVPPGDDQKFASEIDELLAQPDWIATIRQEAAERQPMFSMRYHARQCLGLYRKVAG